MKWGVSYSVCRQQPQVRHLPQVMFCRKAQCLGMLRVLKPNTNQTTSWKSLWWIWEPRLGGDTASGTNMPGSQMCSGELSQCVCALGACQGGRVAALGASWPSAPSQKGFLTRRWRTQPKASVEQFLSPLLSPRFLLSQSCLSVGQDWSCF